MMSPCRLKQLPCTALHPRMCMRRIRCARACIGVSETRSGAVGG